MLGVIAYTRAVSIARTTLLVAMLFFVIVSVYSIYYTVYH